MKVDATNENEIKGRMKKQLTRILAQARRDGDEFGARVADDLLHFFEEFWELGKQYNFRYCDNEDFHLGWLFGMKMAFAMVIVREEEERQQLALKRDAPNC